MYYEELNFEDEQEARVSRICATKQKRSIKLSLLERGLDEEIEEDEIVLTLEAA